MFMAADGRMLTHYSRTLMTMILGVLFCLKKGPSYFIPKSDSLDTRKSKERDFLNSVASLPERNLTNLQDNHSKGLRKILLIEDNPVIQYLHKTMLLEMNCKVDVASDYTTAFHFLDKKYDLILMDIGLPGLSGVEIADKIRKGDSKNKYTKIYALTAFRDKNIEQECSSVGMECVLTKPINFDELNSALDTIKL